MKTVIKRIVRALTDRGDLAEIEQTPAYQEGWKSNAGDLNRYAPGTDAYRSWQRGHDAAVQFEQSIW
ncbi:hypothetical protein [Paraburkholderia elongata]|uniref:Uncharacterized protein n=1 Tax=Paraburkholderia elongata TaxID=2675747 RepID=A0A972NVG1_9BURK|nr:hypothetical protein [Paraburkholderia elongata]NPT59119.1 hypothetical protein [Paraburkholderia elongata]